MTDQPDLPAPLTPADCDLRDFAFMPLDIERLFGSRFHAIATDAEWRAGVTLWLKSFHQVPAASVPDDDTQLCRLAELGRDVVEWQKVRAVALHGWIKCNDGRYYHPTVAEKANVAWERKKQQRERSRRANEARWGGRATTSGTVPASDPASLLDASSIPQGLLQGVPQGLLAGSLDDPKGEGEGQYKGEKEDPPVPPLPTARRAAAQPTDGSAADAEAAAFQQRPGATTAAKRGTRLPEGWHPGPAEVAYATDRGVDPDAAGEEFANYWRARPGREASKLDWPAVFRNRVLELAERGRFPLRQTARCVPTEANPTGRPTTFLSGAF